MAERRALVEGLNLQAPRVEPEKEKAFVFGPTERKTEAMERPFPESTSSASRFQTRVPISTRMRSDLATALKRASLERQLNRVEPNTLVEILEEAVEPWLRQHGYLS